MFFWEEPKKKKGKNIKRRIKYNVRNKDEKQRHLQLKRQETNSKTLPSRCVGRTGYLSSTQPHEARRPLDHPVAPGQRGEEEQEGEEQEGEEEEEEEEEASIPSRGTLVKPLKT